jgi:hypothetical protein
MQWNLQRVAALSGAAETIDEVDRDDSDDNVSSRFNAIYDVEMEFVDTLEQYS